MKLNFVLIESSTYIHTGCLRNSTIFYLSYMFR